MPESTANATTSGSSLPAALGRIPSGLFIVTCRTAAGRGGLLASWVQQAGFEPPMVSVAVRADRPMAGVLAGSGRFVLCQIATESKRLLKAFARPGAAGDDPFEGLPLALEAEGGPVLADAMSYLEAVVTGHLDGGDHRIFLAEVVAGGLIHPEATPMVHLRKNGLNY